MSELDKLSDVVAKMRELGVERYRDGDFEVELGPPPIPPIGAVEPDERRRLIEEAEKQRQEKVLRTLFGASAIRPRMK